MDRKKFLALSGLAGLAALPVGKALAGENPRPKFATPLQLPSLDRLRALATAIPGAPAQHINVIKVADTIRPASVVLAGGDASRKMTLARTVYQVVYPGGTIMLDTGMDLATHRTFGKTIEPFYADSYAMVQEALRLADLIVLTHYHADHTAGLLRSPYFEELAPKVWLTKDTAELMLNKPHKPTIQIDAAKLKNFICVDFDDCLPLAPGIVIFKTPGHTPDSKMLYIKLQDGREFIHSVDSGWSMENIVKQKMKAASWVHENQQQLHAQYTWLNAIRETDPQLTILCTHDDEQYQQFRKAGILGSTLKTS